MEKVMNLQSLLSSDTKTYTSKAKPLLRAVMLANKVVTTPDSKKSGACKQI